MPDLRVFNDGADVVVGDGFVLALVVEGDNQVFARGVEIIEQVRQSKSKVLRIFIVRQRASWMPHLAAVPSALRRGASVPQSRSKR